MRVHISVCTLLICATLGLLAGADPIRTQQVDGIDENVIVQDPFVKRIDEEPSRTNSSLLGDELVMFRRGLMVEDDDGKLVEVTFEEGAASGETEDETISKLNDRVFFRLYTRKNRNEYQPLWIDDAEALARSNFNADKPTRFITHGWVNTANSGACTLIRDAYLKNDDLNVIVVDWSKITLRPYLWAATRVVMVAKHVAKMINYLESRARLDTGKTSLVGHSLGAHVMGLAGYYAKGTINYVVGLDPALPWFVSAGPGSRISTHDATHVQIIHTNAGFLGYLEAIGHTDFYPNGGSKQLGCIVDAGGSCSHARSYKFFAESINSQKGFYGKACNSFLQFITGFCGSKPIALMGGSFIDFEKTGKYFLSTRYISPYAKGH